MYTHTCGEYVYLFIYIIYRYGYTYVHLYFHLCICIYIYVYTRVYMYACMCGNRLCVPLGMHARKEYTCTCVYACEDRVWVGVPALCGALNRGPFVVEREREKQTDRGREKERLRERTSPGGCVDTLGRAATPNSQAPPCGWRWHNHLAEIRDPCPRAACYKRLLDAPARLQRHGSAGKERINALTLRCSEIWRRTRIWCGVEWNWTMVFFFLYICIYVSGFLTRDVNFRRFY